jgi:hypothetical protein
VELVDVINRRLHNNKENQALATRSWEAGSDSAGDADVQDMEFAIDMLRIKMNSTWDLSEKARLYNLIKMLQDNISRLRSERSSERGGHALPGHEGEHVPLAPASKDNLEKEWLDDLLSEMGL